MVPLPEKEEVHGTDAALGPDRTQGCDWVHEPARGVREGFPEEVMLEQKQKLGNAQALLRTLCGRSWVSGQDDG